MAVQNEAFAAQFTRLAGAPDSLDAKVVTTLALADPNLRPLRELDVLASLRMEDCDDRTPESRFLNDTPASIGGSCTTSGYIGLYKPRSFRQVNAKLDAGWRLPDGYRQGAVLEQEDMRRSVSAKYRRNGFRADTSEQSVRLDIKRSMGETLNGSIALIHSERGGSDYVPDTFDPNALTNQVAGLIWADRTRDKLRLSADWLLGTARQAARRPPAGWRLAARAESAAVRRAGPGRPHPVPPLRIGAGRPGRAGAGVVLGAHGAAGPQRAWGLRGLCLGRDAGGI
ncbi:hypothetical protein RA210_U10141 [Rubrivivax sp. A210]|nr:hypothetical protein RA210_U10141 [Rubrivivax sp. A210]